MQNILFFIAGIALGFYIKGRAKSFAPPSRGELDELRKEAHEALSERTEKRKGKILEMLTRNERGCDVERTQKITCSDVEKLLDVSSVTARKYLNELEDEKKIKQIGDVGRGVYYLPI
jgi:predicted HTH transcriptional regulator